MRKWKRRSIYSVAGFLCVLAAVLMLPACGEGNGSRIIFSSGMGKDEVFRIGSSVCTVSEMMVYLTNTGNQYERVYGDQVWKVSRDGVTLKEKVKETVLAKIAQVKTMYLLAESKGITLDEKEKERVRQAAAEYFGSLNDAEKELMDADEDVIAGLYEEYALAEKVYEDIIKDVNPEISDDEARNITVQQIFFRVGWADEEDGKEKDENVIRQAVYDKACEVYEMAVDGEHDFTELASRYSDDSVISHSFGKGERDTAFEQAAFALETGEVSQIIETEAGYYIIKCISTFDKAQTDLNKLQIVEERRREVFSQEYNTFAQTLARQLNTELWDEMTLPQDKEAATSDFFDIYSKYFPGDDR